MTFEILDRYLLEGSVDKASVVTELLSHRAEMPPKANAFMQGLEMLGARVPDLALFALRLVLSGRTADDASVVRLRDAAHNARKAGAGPEAAGPYWKALEAP